MAPFLKFTSKKHTTTGVATNLEFVNTAHIIRATYNEDTKTLNGVVDLAGASSDHKYFEIKGEEAETAVEVLSNLK